jgi:hypothetical protein
MAHHDIAEAAAVLEPRDCRCIFVEPVVANQTIASSTRNLSVPRDPGGSRQDANRGGR